MSDLSGSFARMQMIDYKGSSRRRGRNASNRYFAQVLCDQATQRRAALEAARLAEAEAARRAAQDAQAAQACSKKRPKRSKKA